MPRSLALSVLLIATSPHAQALDAAPATTPIEGVVFVDQDGDGRRDPGEAGFAGAKLSNGRDLVATDADGRYRLALRDGDTLFLVKPPEAELASGEDGLPRFWRHHFPAGSPRLKYGGIAPTRVDDGDFALRLPAREAEQRLEVLLFGDPQPGSTRDVDYYARDIIAPLRATPAAQLGLSLGDIVNDDLALYPAMNRATASLGRAWLHLPGNHDIDWDAARDEDSLLSYRSTYGPDTFAWEEMQASFVLLDDVVRLPGQRGPGYIGGLREDQFAFLAAYLATLPPERPLVVAAHIPFHDAVAGTPSFRAADRARLFALLQPFRRVLLLTSHAHAQRHYFHQAADGWHGAAPLHEYVVGTTCGGFWTGLPDAAGIPDARMEDGTPNGYARLRVEAGDYRLRWHAARDPADTRIALYAPRVLRRGAYPGFGVSANVFMGLPDTQVEYRIDGGEWKPMTRVLRADPALLAINLADDAAERLRSFDRAVEAAPSTHLWRGTLPTHLAPGEHRIEVRAFDRWDGELHASTVYRLEERVPP